jgi:hypothetical protein
MPADGELSRGLLCEELPADAAALAELDEDGLALAELGEDELALSEPREDESSLSSVSRGRGGSGGEGTSVAFCILAFQPAVSLEGLTVSSRVDCRTSNRPRLRAPGKTSSIRELSWTQRSAASR